MDQYLKLLYATKRLVNEAFRLRTRMSSRFGRSPSHLRINGGIRAKGQYSNPTMNKALSNIDDELRLKQVIQDLDACKDKIKKRIEHSDKPLMLQSLYYRIVCEHTWEEISIAIGGTYTARGLKRSARKMEQYCLREERKRYLLKAV